YLTLDYQVWYNTINKDMLPMNNIETNELDRTCGLTDALYPHMTVEKNISYGLKNMKVPNEEIKRKTDWAINILGLEEYRHRKPKKPVNKFVAGFIGSPQMNFFDVTIEGNTVKFADGKQIPLPENIISKLGGKTTGLILGIRGEDIKLDPQNLEVYGEGKQSAVVENTEVMGNENNLYFTFGGAVTVARVSEYEISQVGDTIDFTFVPSKIHFFDKETEESLF
ncbi:MAG: TOBE domain-containing protein, partial [Oscillospiraceae bacterium]|nr:TOBE domain-containing protein [Oscillospiraceae bacterium]